MRKQKRSKLFALTALAFIILFTSCTSCSGHGDGGSGKEDETRAESIVMQPESLSYDEAKQFLIDLHVQTEEGAFILKDNIPYTDNYCTDKYILKWNKRVNYLTDLNSPDEREPFCRDETCLHCDPRCPAYGQSILCTVAPEGSDEIVIYSEWAFGGIDDKIGGINIINIDGVEGGVGFSEYNCKTKVRRTFAFPRDPDPITTLSGGTYYNGVLYVTADYVHGSAETDEFVHCGAFSMDVKSGEILPSELEKDDCFLGIYDGKAYLADRDGTVWRCGLDLRDPVKVCELGYKFSMNNVLSLAFNVKMSGSSICARIVENADEEENGSSVALSGPLRYFDLKEPELGVRDIAEDGCFSFYPEDDYIYFTEYAPETYGYYGDLEISSYTGGTLYRFDVRSGETTTVFENCGGDVYHVLHADNDKIVFSGTYYGAFGTEYNFSDGSPDYMYEFASGKLTLIY